MNEEKKTVESSRTQMNEKVLQKEVSRQRSQAYAHSVNPSPWHGLWALTNRDLRKWYTNPFQLFMSLIQPVIWLGLFGKALDFGAIFTGSAPQLSGAILTSVFGTSSYFSFLAAGMLTFVILFTAMFSGMSIVWDRRFGFLNKVLTTPVARGSIVMAKVLSSVGRSLVQAAIVLVIAVALGMDTSKMTILGVAGSFAAMFLMAIGLSSLFVMLALRSTDWQTQMAIMNLLNLPLLFASNALFPAKFMPEWLQYIVKINPVSYATDAARQLLLGSTGIASLAFDFSFLAGFAVLFSAIGIVMSWRYLTK
ncbi:MAG: ABC transporter permease [Conexivisphaerales archaeon]